VSNGDLRDCDYAKEFPELRHRVLVAERRQRKTDEQLEKIDARLDEVREIVKESVNQAISAALDPILRRLGIVEGRVGRILLLIGGALAALQFVPEKILETLWKVQ
jgi:tetrahydromethanopterin S-methyltransferase subunit G